MTKVLKDLPNYLTLQKRSIQAFPDNQKVALYYCESLKKYFSLVYDKNGYQLLEHSQSVIKELQNVTEITSFNFDDGSMLNIDQECAAHILDLHEQLSEGHDELDGYLMESDKNFLGILKYAINRGI